MSGAAPDSKCSTTMNSMAAVFAAAVSRPPRPGRNRCRGVGSAGSGYHVSVPVIGSGLVHDAFVYSTPEELVEGCVPFLREGIALGEPIMAAPQGSNVALLREALGDEHDRVEWAHGADDHRPGDRLDAFLRFIGRHLSRGAERVRLLGEPAWPSHSRAGVNEWKRYESFLNVALADQPVWLVCPYDAS